jgi:hypothetical protein
LFNYEKLKNGGLIIDNDTRKPLDVGQMKRDFEDCADLFSFFQAIESKMIVITLSEYCSLPNGVQHAWNIYKKVLAEKQKKEKPPHGRTR